MAESNYVAVFDPSDRIVRFLTDYTPAGEETRRRMDLIRDLFSQMAKELAAELPASDEKTAGMRSLLVAKDAFVRAALGDELGGRVMAVKPSRASSPHPADGIPLSGPVFEKAAEWANCETNDIDGVVLWLKSVGIRVWLDEFGRLMVDRMAGLQSSSPPVSKERNHGD